MAEFARRHPAAPITFEVHRVPFFLEPGYLEKPADFTEPHNTRMVRKFGSMDRFEQVKKRHGLIPRGAAVGRNESCGFTQPQLDKRVQSSTLNSHRLVLYVAKTYGLGRSEALYAALNRRHFMEAGVLNDPNMLKAALGDVSVGPGSGLEEAQAFLESDRGTSQVLEMYNVVTEQMGIHSIPTLIVDGKYMISGAATTGKVLDVLERVLSEGPSGTNGVFGDIELDGA